MQSENIFTGKWKIVSVYCYVQQQGWTFMKRYGPGDFIWEFEQERQLLSRVGESGFEGKLHEHFSDTPKGVTEYAYYPCDRKLYIDRSDYEPVGYCNICVNDRYRAEYIRENEYWLYDLEDVEKEPEDYRFRLKIKKIRE